MEPQVWATLEAREVVVVIMAADFPLFEIFAGSWGFLKRLKGRACQQNRTEQSSSQHASACSTDFVSPTGTGLKVLSFQAEIIPMERNLPIVCL